MTEIVRTPSNVFGGITPDEKIKLDAHTKKWNANALSTERVDPPRLTAAIEALYAAAGLKRPRIVIVSSPLVMAFAGGFAAAIWWARKNNARALHDGLVSPTHSTMCSATDLVVDSAVDSATHSATHSATRLVTDSATDSATVSATDSATRSTVESAMDSPTNLATHSTVESAVDSATNLATRSVMDSPTYSVTYSAMDPTTLLAVESAVYSVMDSAKSTAERLAMDSAMDLAFDPQRFAELARALGREFGVNEHLMLRCAQNWARMYQGGNMWSAWDCYLTAYRDVLGLVLPEHEKYKAWEACALEGGFRIVHEEFCIVSDRPVVLKVDDQNRPHCEDGPSHRWHDGWSLYHWHGVSIPGDWVSGRKPSASEALHWPNVEQRRAACEIVGWAHILRELDTRVIDADADTQIGTLLECDIPDSGRARFLKVLCGTGREFVLSVPLDMKTARQANAWTYGLDDADLAVEVRT